MPACTLSPVNRKHQITVVGNDLVKNYGKKRFYSVAEVKHANDRQRINIDYVCWSHAFFNSHTDFDALHSTQGESCDYIAMKREMAESVSNSSSSTWFDFDFDLSWLELPDIDFSIFDFFDF